MSNSDHAMQTFIDIYGDMIGPTACDIIKEGSLLHSGSRVICRPAPENTDDDYFIFVGDNSEKLEALLSEQGFTSYKDKPNLTDPPAGAVVYTHRAEPEIIRYEPTAHRWVWVDHFRVPPAPPAPTFQQDDPYVKGAQHFTAYRKHELNLMVVYEWGMWMKKKLATQVATSMNLTDKAQRIALFEAIENTEIEFDVI